jgi:hypothetical protein
LACDRWLLPIRSFVTLMSADRNGDQPPASSHSMSHKPDTVVRPGGRSRKLRVRSRRSSTDLQEVSRVRSFAELDRGLSIRPVVRPGGDRGDLTTPSESSRDPIEAVTRRTRRDSLCIVGRPITLSHEHQFTSTVGFRGKTTGQTISGPRSPPPRGNPIGRTLSS